MGLCGVIIKSSSDRNAKCPTVNLISYLVLSRSLSLGRIPWRGGLDKVGDNVPDTHGDQLSTALHQWVVVAVGAMDDE